jgi:hypothetical protein
MSLRNILQSYIFEVPSPRGPTDCVYTYVQETEKASKSKQWAVKQ